jgi:uncharacterized membrane protein
MALALNAALIALALLASLCVRPWRMLVSKAHSTELLSPLLGTLVVLPWLWALPALHHSPLQLHWSGAPMVTLMLGWPLAVPALVLVGCITCLISGTSVTSAMNLIVWQGLVPATFTLLLGAAVRRWLSRHVFVYVLGRGFIGSVLCLFASSLLAQVLGHQLPNIQTDLSRVALWLMAWGDAFITGMTCAIFVAYRPQWLATWSDGLYLK